MARRFGGAEFVVVLPGASLEMALQRVGQQRQAFMEIRIPCSGVAIACTFSAGVASYPMHAQDIAGLPKAADQALYAAKQNGRNRVMQAD